MVSIKSVRINSKLLRQMRIDAGLSQLDFAKLSGYSERLIRKAEVDGSISKNALGVLAATLCQAGISVTPSQLCIDQLSIARTWVEAWRSMKGS